MKKLMLLLLLVLLLTGCGQVVKQINDEVYYWEDQTYIPDSYNYVTPNTMLVLGNSIASCPGWLGSNAGMAASSIDKDYSHILAGLIGVTTSSLTVKNCWDIEAGFRTYDFNTLPEADLVIIQLGDNIINCNNYNFYLSNMIKRYKDKGIQVILISTILPGGGAQQDKNHRIQYSAKEMEVPYLDLRGICLDSANIPGTGPENQHPNDLGMRLIAERIYSLIK